MKKATLAIAVTVGMCLLFPGNIPARYIDTESPYFSYERFYLQLDILTGIADDGRTRGDVKAFARNLADGIRAISADDPEKAKARLLRARAIWPEYFGTYFLLARVNEDTGNYALAARFYKNYLNNLKDFSEGHYRISGPLIKLITPYNVENYDEAYTLVRDRLEKRGMDLASVQPFYAMPGILKLFILFIILGIGYAIAAYKVIPHLDKKRRINNPPEGSWACKKCGTYNLNVRLTCEKCGEKKE